MDIFGSTDPRHMPLHFFGAATHLDYAGAIRAEVEKQNYSVCPRHWYMDAAYTCPKCGTAFTWSAREQKVWFEEYKFWIDARPKLCRACMAQQKAVKALIREYTETIAEARKSKDFSQKRRIVEIVNILEQNVAELPSHFISTRNEFITQIGAPPRG